MIIRKASAQELRRSEEVRAVGFEYAIQPETDAAPAEDSTKWYLALTEDESEAMGTVGVGTYPVFFDGNTCLMGGIGGVATLPQYRRRGCIRGCFDLALREMYADGYVLSYLFPFSSAYYRQFGYESFLERLVVTVKLDTLRPLKTDGSHILVKPGNPMTEEIRALDRIREKKYNLMVQHDEEFYSWTRRADPAVQKEYTYVYLSADGTPKAYTTFRPDVTPNGRVHRCSRFVFHDREGFHGLMNLFKSCAADHTAVQFTLPCDSSMLYLPQELALGSVEISHQMQGSVRVVNVKAALEMARYRGSGSAVLRILDPMLPENNRSFAVVFENGRAKSVTETAAEPDAVLEIATFSALLMGAAEFEDAAAHFGGLEVRNGEALSQVFFPKKAFLVDFF